MKYLAFILLVFSLAVNPTRTYSWDADAAKFYPLAVGNKWVYAWYYTFMGNTVFQNSENYPNPVNPVSKFGFRIADFGSVKLTIYDAIGKEIIALVNEELKPGTYEVSWNAPSYPSGVYYYKLESDKFTETKKMVLIK